MKSINNEKGITLIMLIIVLILIMLLGTIIMISDIPLSVLQKKNEVINSYNEREKIIDQEKNNIKTEWGNVILRKGIDNELIMN